MECERRVGLSTLVNPFHIEQDPPDVIGLDNNTGHRKLNEGLQEIQNANRLAPCLNSD